MTPVELEELVRAALAAEGHEDLDRSGRSIYDYASDALKQAASQVNSFNIVPSMLDIAKANLAKSTEWWLNFLGLYEQIEFLPRAANQLAQFFLNSPPTRIEPRAYVLRFLAYIGSPIQWSALPVGLRIDDLARISPLVVADALVWGLNFQDARRVLSRALDQHTVTSLDIRQMVERWKRTARPANTAEIEEISSLCEASIVQFRPTEKERFSTIVAAFGRNLRDKSRFYAPAKQHGYG